MAAVDLLQGLKERATVSLATELVQAAEHSGQAQKIMAMRSEPYLAARTERRRGSDAQQTVHISKLQPVKRQHDIERLQQPGSEPCIFPESTMSSGANTGELGAAALSSGSGNNHWT